MLTETLRHTYNALTAVLCNHRTQYRSHAQIVLRYIVAEESAAELGRDTLTG